MDWFCTSVLQPLMLISLAQAADSRRPNCLSCADWWPMRLTSASVPLPLLMQVQEPVVAPAVTMSLPAPDCNTTSVAALADQTKRSLTDGANITQAEADTIHVKAQCNAAVSRADVMVAYVYSFAASSACVSEQAIWHGCLCLMQCIDQMSCRTASLF